MAEGVEKGMNTIIALGVGVFILTLILALTYSGYAQTRNQLVTNYGSLSGVVSNFTTNGGQIANTYGSNTNLAVFALVFVAIIAAVIFAIRGRSGAEGGILS